MAPRGASIRIVTSVVGGVRRVTVTGSAMVSAPAGTSAATSGMAQPDKRNSCPDLDGLPLNGLLHNLKRRTRLGAHATFSTGPTNGLGNRIPSRLVGESRARRPGPS